MYLSLTKLWEYVYLKTVLSTVAWKQELAWERQTVTSHIICFMATTGMLKKKKKGQKELQKKKKKKHLTKTKEKSKIPFLFWNTFAVLWRMYFYSLFFSLNLFQVCASDSSSYLNLSGATGFCISVLCCEILTLT